MGLLDGEIQTIVGDAARFLMLDATIHQSADGTFDPATGEVSSDTVTNTAVTQCGFPDVAIDDYAEGRLLQANERLLVLLQKPIIDAGLTLVKGDEITLRSQRSEILEIVEDPAEATFVCKVRP